jgi:hypothetical protein
MKNRVLLLIVYLLFNLSVYAASYLYNDKTDTIDDGPYIYKLSFALQAEWLENGELKEAFILPGNYDEIKDLFKFAFTYNDLHNIFYAKPDYRQSFKNVDSICVISDVHGQYNKYINILRATHVIDKNLTWQFGKGHLVVLGDIFDRGDRVTEILWHLFGLEKQARKAGGMVHVMLGNHELMVLNNDLRYIHEKYQDAAAYFNKSYYDLFSQNSVLGKWLRLKPVAMTINDILFIHGGISMDMVIQNLKIKQINQLVYENIFGGSAQPVNNIDQLGLLGGDQGPFWYRGYFSDTTFCESRVDSILNFFSKQHIVVGHTTFSHIQTLYNNKIFGVDAGISYQQPGEALLYKNGIFYKVTDYGDRIRF